jgi:endonuclease/exonuclease/phosphatase family metal-dependent hydrolase
MSAAKDALTDIRPDILCLQEVRDWDGVAELVSILPGLQTSVVSRFREMGSSGPLSIQQTAVASNRPAEAAWSESFKPSPVTPPRGFSFAAIRHGETMLLVYSVHLKSNIGEAAINVAKREEAARQLLAHVVEMESAYSGTAEVVTVICGDFNTDPTDARFAVERTFAILKEKFVWPWENVAISQRVTNPAKDRYPDACFDGFLVRGARKLSCKPIPIQGVSDHFPVVLTVAIDRSDVSVFSKRHWISVKTAQGSLRRPWPPKAARMRFGALRSEDSHRTEPRLRRRSRSHARQHEAARYSVGRCTSV